MSDKINIRGVNFDSVTLDSAYELCRGFINDKKGGAKSVYTPNSEIVQLCVEAPENYQIINSADLIIPDGIGVVLASKILKTPLVHGKVAGVELCERLIASSAENGWRLFFLGGKPGVAEAAAQKLTAKYPGISICGLRDGYFKDETEVIDCINAASPDILFVCLGAPKQEKFIFENKSRLNVGLAGGFGGSLDVFAGTAKRAPDIFIKLGLEWFYRLLCQPSRIGRMMKLPKFILGVIFSKKN